MKKISKIILQDKVVLGDIEMRYIMGGGTTGIVGIECKFNANHNNCADTTSACKMSPGWGNGESGRCVFQINTDTNNNYSVSCYCKD